MGRWIRVDAMLHEHPKLTAVGPWGLCVIMAAWRMSKVHGFLGDIPSAFWTPAMMARWTLWGPEHEDDLARAMDACIEHRLVELIARNGDTVTAVDRYAVTHYRLHDWAFYQKDDTAADRQKRWRERHSKARKDDTVTSKNAGQGQGHRHGHKDQEIAPDASTPPSGSSQPPAQVEVLAPLSFDYQTNRWNRHPTNEEWGKWALAFPAVDHRVEWNQATLWLQTNHHRRKKDFHRFIQNWFAKSQRYADARTR